MDHCAFVAAQNCESRWFLQMLSGHACGAGHRRCGGDDTNALADEGVQKHREVRPEQADRLVNLGMASTRGSGVERHWRPGMWMTEDELVSQWMRALESGAVEDVAAFQDIQHTFLAKDELDNQATRVDAFDDKANFKKVEKQEKQEKEKRIDTENQRIGQLAKNLAKELISAWDQLELDLGDPAVRIGALSTLIAN